MHRSANLIKARGRERLSIFGREVSSYSGQGGAHVSPPVDRNICPAATFLRMKRFYFGLAAFVGTVLLFMGWLADHDRKAAIERLEQWESHTSGKAR